MMRVFWASGLNVGTDTAIIWRGGEGGVCAMTAVISDFFARKVKIIILFILTYIALC